MKKITMVKVKQYLEYPYILSKWVKEHLRMKGETDEYKVIVALSTSLSDWVKESIYESTKILNSWQLHRNKNINIVFKIEIISRYNIFYAIKSY